MVETAKAPMATAIATSRFTSILYTVTKPTVSITIVAATMNRRQSSLGGPLAPDGIFVSPNAPVHRPAAPPARTRPPPILSPPPPPPPHLHPPPPPPPPTTPNT